MLTNYIKNNYVPMIENKINDIKLILIFVIIEVLVISSYIMYAWKDHISYSAIWIYAIPAVTIIIAGIILTILLKSALSLHDEMTDKINSIIHEVEINKIFSNKNFFIHTVDNINKSFQLIETVPSSSKLVLNYTKTNGAGLIRVYACDCLNGSTLILELDSRNEEHLITFITLMSILKYKYDL